MGLGEKSQMFKNECQSNVSGLELNLGPGNFCNSVNRSMLGFTNFSLFSFNFKVPLKKLQLGHTGTKEEKESCLFSRKHSGRVSRILRG